MLSAVLFCDLRTTGAAATAGGSVELLLLTLVVRWVHHASEPPGVVNSEPVWADGFFIYTANVTHGLGTSPGGSDNDLLPRCLASTLRRKLIIATDSRCWTKRPCVVRAYCGHLDFGGDVDKGNTVVSRSYTPGTAQRVTTYVCLASVSDD